MRKTYCIELEGNDLGQLLDGLELRAEAWEPTGAYLLGQEFMGDDFFIPEECHKPEEANDIAAHYRSIIHRIGTRMEVKR